MFARGRDEGERQQIRGHGDQCAAFLRVGNDAGVVENPARSTRLLEDDAVYVAVGQTGGEVRDLYLEAQRLSTALHDGDGLRKEVGVQNSLAILGRLVLVGPAHQQHGLGHGGGFIQQGSVRHGKAGEILHHGLEVEESFKAALGNFRLVRRVGRVPRGSFQDVAADDRGRDGVVVALADHLDRGLVLGCELPQFGEDLHLGEGILQFQGRVLADGIGDGYVHQAVDRVVADGLEHGVNVGLAPGADVPVRESGGG
ncbi:hypothetical protein PJL18_02545 [Paenarthrobacter nicotinovorans]|nr:hypothetical protein [Paenarthrobacter nicotinovorans]